MYVKEKIYLHSGDYTIEAMQERFDLPEATPLALAFYVANKRHPLPEGEHYAKVPPKCIMYFYDNYPCVPTVVVDGCVFYVSEPEIDAELELAKAGFRDEEMASRCDRKFPRRPCTLQQLSERPDTIKEVYIRYEHIE